MFNYSKYNLGLDGCDFGKIKYCPMFLAPAQVLRPYVSPENLKSSLDLQKYYAKFGYNLGVDLVPYNELSSLTKADYAIDTYSPAMGVVLDVTEYQLRDNSIGKAVVIQYDADYSFRVSNLTVVNVKKGDSVVQGNQIGTAKKFIHFEVLRYYKEYSTAKSYIFDKLRLFLSDPMPYFDMNFSGLDDGYGE